jgi:hypothetical protein
MSDASDPQAGGLGGVHGSLRVARAAMLRQ